MRAALVDPASAALRLSAAIASTDDARRSVSFVRIAVAAFAVAVSPAPHADVAPGFTLEFIGEHIIASGTRFAGTTIGGLSGIDYDPERDVYYVISDARGREARFYTLTIELCVNAIEAVTFTGVTRLSDTGGRDFGWGGTGLRPDPESLRWDRARQVFFWASEGDGSAGLNPSLREASADGRTQRVFAAPAKFHRSPDHRNGVRTNRAFESLALSADGSRLYVANEGPLLQDGPAASARRGATVRIVAIDASSGEAVGEYAYPLEPVPHVPVNHRGARENGLVELLVLDPARLLALERAYVAGVGNYADIYAFTLDGADDISARSTLEHESGWRALRKTRIASLETFAAAIRAARRGTALEIEPRLLDNIEGMTFGPEIAGTRTLVFVADDNFGLYGPQFTQFLAFRLVSLR
ncbi:MAG: esterase-like activity of phytase family protein [Gammaproteobacteria bacterium]|jgi:hypothetical protein